MNPKKPATFILGLTRIIAIVIAIFTNYYSQAYETVFWPVVGWLFMPITSLTYMAAKLNNGQVSGVWLVLMVLAIVLDFGLSERAVGEL